MSAYLPYIIGGVAGVIIWTIWVRPWQRRQYERDLERLKRGER